jgi:hypothetical protein
MDSRAPVAHCWYLVRYQPPAVKNNADTTQRKKELFTTAHILKKPRPVPDPNASVSGNFVGMGEEEPKPVCGHGSHDG